jgi:hypothetical protein
VNIYGQCKYRRVRLTHAIDQPRQQCMSSGCCQVLLPSFIGPLHAYWCVVYGVFTQYGPQHVQFGFFRAPIRRVGAVPHTLTPGNYLHVSAQLQPIHVIGLNKMDRYKKNLLHRRISVPAVSFSVIGL